MVNSFLILKINLSVNIDFVSQENFSQIQKDKSSVVREKKRNLQFAIFEKHSTKIHKKEPFILYPNPATDNLTIEFTNVLDNNATFVLYDLSGRKMIRYNLEKTNNKFNINVSTLQSGIYIYNVSSNEVTTGKIIINN